tara:strand:+ start:456 stop:899 length:444 start_codon:yes stop_codon:yes gene_type:complete
MSQRWRKDPRVEACSATTTYSHFHTVITVLESARIPLGIQRQLAGTAAIVDCYKDDRVAVAFALVSPNDNGSRAIGREIAGGRALKLAASFIQDVELVAVPELRYLYVFRNREMAEIFVLDAKKEDDVRRFLDVTCSQIAETMNGYN